MSAASLATSVAVCTEMPTSASCSATASFTPSPRKPTVVPRARCALITRDFCSGVTRAKMVVPRQRRGERVVVELLELGACERAARSEADVRADLLSHAVVVARDHLHLDLQPRKPRERRPRVGLRAVHEGEQAGEPEASLSAGSTLAIPSAGRVATAITRLPAGTDARGPHGPRASTPSQRAITASGAPLTTISRRPSGFSTSTDASCR